MPCCSVNRDLRMTSSLMSRAILSTFSWPENRSAGQFPAVGLDTKLVLVLRRLLVLKVPRQAAL